MKLAIDFDSTVWPLLPAMGIAYEEVTYWGHLPDMLGGIEEMNQAFTKVMPFQHAVNHPPFPGCVDTLKALKEKGVEIHLITHRETCYLSDVEEYIEHFDLPVDHIDCSPLINKVQTCLDRSISILVDDHPDIVIQAADAGLDAYMLLFHYNRHAREHGVTGCTDWQDLSTYLHSSLGL